jgi:hypothetical protein
MKSTLVLALAFSAMPSLYAQNCPSPQGSADLEVNNIKARILTGGDLFTDGNNGKMLYLPDPAQPSTLFNAALWMGGVDPGGNLKVSGTAYRLGSTSFTPGPLDYQTSLPLPSGCNNWDKVFSVKQTEIVSFLAIGGSLSTAEKIQQFPSIMGWPARGNPFFAGIHGFDLPNTFQGLAPFVDYDGTGDYNPNDGDLPAVLLRGQAPFIPGQITWCVMNDMEINGSGGINTPSLGMEVQLTAWAFSCPDVPVLQNTVFTSHKMIYRGFERLDSCFIGLFTDFDLGCYADDYVGCAPGLNTQYAYNTDVVDGNLGNSCSGTATFTNTPPVQTVTFLDQQLDKFLSIGDVNAAAATTLPATGLEYYNYLTGHWRDGTPLTSGGTGYNPASSIPANHVYPNDPADPNGWSMCTNSQPLADRRVIGSIDFGSMDPGYVTELTTAWSVTPNVPLPCGLGSALENVVAIQNIYHNNFNGCGNLISPTHALEVEPLRITPNPASEEITVRLGNTTADELRVIAADGRVLRTLHHPSGDQMIAVNDLANGWYLVQVVTAKGIQNGRIVVQR